MQTSPIMVRPLLWLAVLGACRGPAPPALLAAEQAVAGSGEPVWAAPSAPGDAVVAQVGARGIGVGRLRARLSGDAGQPPVSLRSALEEEVEYTLLLQAAYDRGLHRDPEVVEHAQRVMVRRLLRAELSGYSDAAFKQRDEAELRAAYEARKQSYVRPARRLLAGAQWGRSEADRQRALTLLKTLPVPVPDGFVARWRAGHPGVRAVAGMDDKSWWESDALAQKLGREVAAAIMAAPVGTVVPQVLSCPVGWCVVHVQAEQVGRVRDFDEVREEIREKLEHGQRGEQFERFLAELRAVYPVTIDAQVQRDLESTWPAAD